MAVTWGIPTPVTSRVVHAAPGPHANENTVNTRLHQLQRHVVADAVPDDHRNVHQLKQLRELQPALAPRYVPGRGHRGLHNYDVSPRLGGQRGKPFGPRRRKRNGALGATALDLLDALTDQLFPDRSGVHLLEHGGHLDLGSLHDLLNHTLRVFVPAVDALHVGDGQAAETVHLTGELGRRHRVHRSAKYRSAQIDPVDGKAGIGQLGVDRYRPRRDGYLVETVHSSKLFDVRDPHGSIPPKGIRLCRHLRFVSLP